MGIGSSVGRVLRLKQAEVLLFWGRTLTVPRAGAVIRRGPMYSLPQKHKLDGGSGRFAIR